MNILLFIIMIYITQFQDLEPTFYLLTYVNNEFAIKVIKVC